MRIAFVDPIDWDYVVETPRTRPLGGSQSSLCYLAEELTLRGHAVALFNGTKVPAVSRGVSCFSLAQTRPAQLSEYEAVIVLNSADSGLARQIRDATGPRGRVILWSQHLHDQPAVRELADPATHSGWDALVLCSAWHANDYREGFGFPQEKTKVLGNAMGPAFENLYPDPARIAALKPWPPVLCYTSTPFRGLDVLLLAFPRIRERIPGTTLKVFSSMSVYGIGAAQDAYAPLYEKCRQTDGAHYVGSLSQEALARELAAATCLAYPNTFIEAYCISLVESLAAGLVVITSDLGALREVASGYAHLLVPPPDKLQHAEAYADFAVSVLQDTRSAPQPHARGIEDQVRHFNRTATWKGRAQEWEAWLWSLVAPPA